MRTLSAAMILLLVMTTAPRDVLADSRAHAAGKTKWPECFCTDRAGKRRELGEIICISVGERSYMAKCIMAQNVPFWRDIGRPCVSSRLQDHQTPAQPAIIALYR